MYKFFFFIKTSTFNTMKKMCKLYIHVTRKVKVQCSIWPILQCMLFVVHITTSSYNKSIYIDLFYVPILCKNTGKD